MTTRLSVWIVGGGGPLSWDLPDDAARTAVETIRQWWRNPIQFATDDRELAFGDGHQPDTHLPLSSVTCVRTRPVVGAGDGTGSSAGIAGILHDLLARRGTRGSDL